MSPNTSAIPVQHIALDEQGRAYIEGTRIRVVELISAKVANRWDAEELARHYAHLSLAQIHSALSYYYDHQAGIDREIDRVAADYQRHRGEASQSAIGELLRDRMSGGK